MCGCGRVGAVFLPKWIFVAMLMDSSSGSTLLMGMLAGQPARPGPPAGALTPAFRTLAG